MRLLCRGEYRGCSLELLKRPFDVSVACLWEPWLADKRPLAELVNDRVGKPVFDCLYDDRVLCGRICASKGKRLDDVTFNDAADTNAKRGGLGRGYKIEVGEQRVGLVGRVGCIHRYHARGLEPELLLCTRS